MPDETHEMIEALSRRTAELERECGITDRQDDWPHDTSTHDLATRESATYARLEEGTPGTGDQG